MSEREFWEFLNRLLGKGRIAMRSGGSGCRAQGLNEVEMFMDGHALLPEGYAAIRRQDIRSMGELLAQEGIELRTKQAILILLAHHPSREALAILEKYNRFPDARLKIFAELALDECRMWNGEESPDTGDSAFCTGVS